MMTGAEKSEQPSEPTRLLCLVPPELAGKLLDPLRRHYARLGVEVLEEQRSRERRSGAERRKQDEGPPEGVEDRRLIKSQDGRRAGERRASLVPADPPAELPRKARPYADRIAFYERIPVPEERAQDLDTARLVARIQAGDRGGFTQLYERYFDRVYGYLRVVLKDSHEAEDIGQQVFIKVLEALPGYEQRRQPFRAWLFTIARNSAVSHLRKQGRSDVVDPEVINRHRGDLADKEVELSALGWITDRDLMMFIERLPEGQRQVLTLRYMLDLTARETGEILGRQENEVRMLQHRAQRFLEERLTALGRDPHRGRRIRWRGRLRQAVVVRERRFALHP